MDFEEDQLREVLDDPSWELPTWPEGAARVRRAARRRRQRRLTALFTAVAFVAAVGGVATWQLRAPAGKTRLTTQTPASHRSPFKEFHAARPKPNAKKPTTSTSELPAGFEPASATFVTPTSAWVLGTDRHCVASPCTVMARTTNGNVWTSVPAPPDALPATSGAPGAGISGVRFANPKDGWAFGPDLWATHDGGRGWTLTTLPGDDSVIDLEADPQTVWVLAATYSPSTGYGSPQLFESPAGSNDFRVVSGATFGAGTAVSLAVSGQTAWLAGPGQLVATTSGGSLQARTDPCATSTAPQLSAFGDLDLVVACSSKGTGGSVTEQVFLSTNGGNSYAKLSAPPGGGKVDGVTTNGSTVVVATSSPGASVLYADAGRGWQAVYSAPGGADLVDLGFTTATQGVVIVGRPGADRATTMLLSRDGGLHWSRVTFY